MTGRSSDSPSNPARTRANPARVAGIYLVFSITWIWLSDRALLWIGLGGVEGFWASAIKGTAFVALSAAILYWLIRRELRALMRVVALLQAVTEGTTDAVFVKDQDGKYLLFNQAAAEFVGKSVEEVLGQDDTALFKPESARKVMEQDRLVMRTGAPLTQEAELTVGTLTRTYLSTKAPYRDANGSIIGVVGVSRDITDRKRAEEQLRASEERYRDLVELSPEGVSILQDGRFAYINRSGANGLGLEPVDLVGRRLSEFLHPDDLATSAERQAIVTREQRVVPLRRFRLSHADGTWRVMESRGGPCRFEGKPAIQVVARDVTERIRSEQALCDSETRLRLFVDHVWAPIAMFDRDMRYLYFSRRWLTDYRLGDRDITGLSHYEVFPEIPEQWREIHRRCLTGAVDRCEEDRFERADGTVQWLRWEIRPWHRVDGEVGGIVMFTEDITLRRQAEETLRLNEARYRLISEMTSDYVYSIRLKSTPTAAEVGSVADSFVDYENEWVTQSFTAITGYAWSDVVAAGGWMAIIHPDDMPGLQPFMMGLVMGQSGVAEYRIRTKAGEIRWLRDYCRPVWDEKENRVVRLYGAVQDITERRRLEDQLRQAQKMEAVGRLAGGVAHDFNNLLTVINGYSDLVMRGMSPSDPAREALHHIRAAGERAARLTQQLLAYGRKAMVELKILDLNELVAESTKLLRRLIGEDIVVTSNLQPGLNRIKVDRGQLEQVIMNLAVNARDAMSTGGTITIETRDVTLAQEELPDPELAPGKYVQLTISDNGVGMTDDVKAHLFEPFFTTKEQGKGTGLGLAVVHGAIKQSGGHIGVASELGVGTTFTILLPAVGDVAPLPSGLVKHLARGTETILLVEDEDAVRRIARIGLEHEGYTVLAASGAAEALSKFEECGKAIDLLVTDVVMPEIGGRQLAETLRIRQPGLRVLYVSGYTDDVVVRHGLAEVGDFLQKPFTAFELSRKVRELLDAVANENQ